MSTPIGPAPPVDASEAQGAQIPLEDFNIPAFPPSARSLRALTLTSEIKPSDYESTLSKSFSVPPLPPAIESLTLELFSLGYPAGFLSQLASRLPNLKSVVIYSQLFAGISEASTADAVQFFKTLQSLRAVHLLDVFAKPGFFSQAAKWLTYNVSDVPGEARRGLMFLEVNYTFHPEDEAFMEKICAAELPAMVGPGLVSCSFNVSTAEEEPTTASSQQQRASDGGVMAFNTALSTGLVAALTDDETSPKGLRALNTTLYTMTLPDLEKVLRVQQHVMVLNVCVEMDPGEATKKRLINALKQCKRLEQVEIVCNPTIQFFMSMQEPNNETLAKSLPAQADMTELSKTCEKLTSFRANLLRSTALGAVRWVKKQSGWSGGVHERNIPDLSQP